jgi:hypothetical protein
VRKDVNALFDVFTNSAGPYITSLGACILAVSLLNWFSIFLILFLLNRYSVGSMKNLVQTEPNIELGTVKH